MKLTKSLFALLFGFLFLCSTQIFAQSTDRAALASEIESLRSQLNVREEAFLEPAAEDRAAFAEFLKQPDTGIIRLLPREVYDARNKLTIRGGGAFYSFAKLTHEYGYGNDILLEQGNLSVGFAGADYGVMANLGNVPMDKVSVESPAVGALESLTTPTSLPNARIEQHRSGEGITIENVLYKNRTPALVENTYILRSINYDRSDVLVAFRVVRKDQDGSLILVWKMLKKYDTPKLDRTVAEGSQ